MLNPLSRQAHHAKVIDHDGRQVALWLSRRESDDALCVVMQVWVASVDAPLRAQIVTASDDDTAHLFASMTAETIGMHLDKIGMLKAVAEYE